VGVDGTRNHSAAAEIELDGAGRPELRPAEGRDATGAREEVCYAGIGDRGEPAVDEKSGLHGKEIPLLVKNGTRPLSSPRAPGMLKQGCCFRRRGTRGRTF
jgi:hypothetical protein